MDSALYVLDEHGQPQRAGSLRQWGQWFAKCDRQVARDVVGDAEVSTVFLGVDHNWGAGDPVLWETLVFGGPLDGEQRRYQSLTAARRGHAEMVALVQRGRRG